MNELRQAILCDLIAHPGSLARDIAARTGLSGGTVGGCLRRLRDIGLVEVEGLGKFGADRCSISRWSARGFLPAAGAAECRPDRAKSRAVLNDLIAHPGSLARDIAARIGLSVFGVGAVLRNLRRVGLVDGKEHQAHGDQLFVWAAIGVELPEPCIGSRTSRMDDFIAPEDLAWMAYWRLPREARRKLPKIGEGLASGGHQAPVSTDRPPVFEEVRRAE